MMKVPVKVYEIPTIQGMFPRMFRTTINNGMRKGIPKPIWGSVITIYDDGEKVQEFTGNENTSSPDLIAVLVSDDAIKEVSAQLPNNIPQFHASGVSDLEVLCR